MANDRARPAMEGLFAFADGHFYTVTADGTSHRRAGMHELRGHFFPADRGSSTEVIATNGGAPSSNISSRGRTSSSMDMLSRSRHRSSSSNSSDDNTAKQEPKSREDDGGNNDRPASWYEAQLRHYGLPASTSPSVARQRLLDAVSAGRLAVPRDIGQIQRRLRAAWNRSQAEVKTKRTAGSAARACQDSGALVADKKRASQSIEEQPVAKKARAASQKASRGEEALQTGRQGANYILWLPSGAVGSGACALPTADANPSAASDAPTAACKSPAADPAADEPAAANSAAADSAAADSAAAAGSGAENSGAECPGTQCSESECSESECSESDSPEAESPIAECSPAASPATFSAAAESFLAETPPSADEPPPAGAFSAAAESANSDNAAQGERFLIPAPRIPSRLEAASLPGRQTATIDNPGQRLRRLNYPARLPEGDNLFAPPGNPLARHHNHLQIVPQPQRRPAYPTRNAPPGYWAAPGEEDPSPQYVAREGIATLGALNPFTGAYMVRTNVTRTDPLLMGPEHRLRLGVSDDGVWAAFDMGILEGIMHVPQHPLFASNRSLHLQWWAREHRTMRSISGVGFIRFLGGGIIEGGVDHQFLRFRGRQTAGPMVVRWADLLSMHVRWDTLATEERVLGDYGEGEPDGDAYPPPMYRP